MENPIAGTSRVFPALRRALLVQPKDSGSLKAGGLQKDIAEASRS